MYKVNIVAYDLGTPRNIVNKTIDIIISPVNEYPPLFDKTLFLVYVNETQNIDVEIVKLRAKDNDGGDSLTYQVFEENQQSDLFC